MQLHALQSVGGGARAGSLDHLQSLLISHAKFPRVSRARRRRSAVCAGSSDHLPSHLACQASSLFTCKEVLLCSLGAAVQALCKPSLFQGEKALLCSLSPSCRLSRVAVVCGS